MSEDWGGERGDLERDKSQELLDELRGVREGLDRLAASVEEVGDILSEATGIELVDEGEEGGPEPESGAAEAFKEIGHLFVEMFKSRNRRSPKAQTR